jgi:hypothetical protein
VPGLHVDTVGSPNGRNTKLLFAISDYARNDLRHGTDPRRATRGWRTNRISQGFKASRCTLERRIGSALGQPVFSVCQAALLSRFPFSAYQRPLLVRCAVMKRRSTSRRVSSIQVYISSPLARPQPRFLFLHIATLTSTAGSIPRRPDKMIGKLALLGVVAVS